MKYLSLGCPEKSRVDPKLIKLYDKRHFISTEEKRTALNDRNIYIQAIRSSGHEKYRSIPCAVALVNRGYRDRVSTCHECQENGPNITDTQIYPWSHATEPWNRPHIDFTGKVDGYYWFIIIDSYTKWVEIYTLEQISTNETIRALEDCFARFRLPRYIVSDNGK
ncbi:hypothetical protein RF11_09234 [Thelohanellus kitauei]|uniref:Integrase catalytic domain-containing protein n=1 Tax=Thelohanellus kitauei TaxID=669202 RepID=A0A0C2N4E6_THEKT|nr:hypothetical protein RF11_09234 [Thelohanellus kitauei]